MDSKKLGRILRKGAMMLEDVVDSALNETKARVGRTYPLSIFPYRSFGNAQHMFFWGRVMADKGITVDRSDSFLENVENSIKRIDSDEIPGAKVKIRFYHQTITTTTDEEGYYLAEMTFDDPIPTKDTMWETAYLSLEEAADRSQEELKKSETTADVLVPPQSVKDFGIISDIDDTVMKTEATSLIKSAKLTFFSNAYNRAPFQGVSALYNALVKGKDGKQNHPIFYVSSSMWNLYDLLVDFMKHNDIPTGPLLLRDIGLTEDSWVKGGHEHKLDKINRILSYYDHLQFVLIGDSGQHDPELYYEAIKSYPDRIAAVYIRNVSSADREREVERICKKVHEAFSIPFMLVKDSLEAGKHAVEQGFIPASALQDIEEHVERDKGHSSANP